MFINYVVLKSVARLASQTGELVFEYVHEIISDTCILI